MGRPYTRLGREATNDQEVALKGMIYSGSADSGERQGGSPKQGGAGMLRKCSKGLVLLNEVSLDLFRNLAECTK